ncbi:precorrin-6y C5,15-methyltransferase (decarboxylating) subunit CbiE [Bacteroides caecimuris]|uniref:precorrin-6y C5,15-methyltransferase (decarboxylating) subunit CbiE n=1 Tax=Bacteroides caecimuris TaxID=1796613 RepID=UPI002647A6A0|nr:precorrin-6y C5,15-methyltransferase (decarboxylating) subunit CbiE [Bacteroides caecimuris]
MSEKIFHIIGISDQRNQFFTPEIIELISKGKVFSGGRRHHEIVAEVLPGDAVWIDITVPLDKVYRHYLYHNDIVVFASGDPLFYGFANTLRREFPSAKISVHPTFNSLQLLAHRLLLPYAGMINISVTGRPWKALDVALLENRPLIGVLTDHKKGPLEIAARLLNYGYDNYEISVGECLGNDTENIKTLSLQEALVQSFANPNCVILQMTSARRRYFGIPENLFAHLAGRSNMITKMPVRLLSLSMLDLYGRKVMWDVGFCTGSVSIEAKLQFPALDIIAFERREESRNLLDDNCRRFGVPGITGVIADFMDCDLSDFPRPDAVFIGGHGGRLDTMVCRIYKVLNKDGVIVFNSVSTESCQVFRRAIESCGGVIEAEHTMILDSHNPITILKAK